LGAPVAILTSALDVVPITTEKRTAAYQRTGAPELESKIRYAPRNAATASFVGLARAMNGCQPAGNLPLPA
jgi:hypothetical protein